MKYKVRLTESDLHKIIKESVKRILIEGRLDQYPSEFIEYMKQHGSRWPEELPDYMLRNSYEAYQQEQAEQNFQQGMKVGDKQGFREKDGNIHWYGEFYDGMFHTKDGWTLQNPLSLENIQQLC